MLVLLPALLPLATALAILVWQQARPGYGIPWLLAASMALVNWIVLLALHFRMPLFLVMNTWFALGEQTEFPYFQLDLVSWPYAFSLAGLVVAIIFTGSARLLRETTPRAWAGSLAISGFGMLAILSANLLTMAAAWTAIDLIELAVLLATVREQRLSARVVLAFSARLAGTLALIWAVLQGHAAGLNLTFGQIPAEISITLLLSAGLRLGVLPLHLPYTNEIPMRRGVGTILRLVGPATSLVLLARLPGNAVPATWAPFLLAFTALAVAYCAVMWLAARNELNGRPYWLIALAGLAIACVIRGQPVAGMAWGITLLLSGGFIFLYSARDRGISWLPVLGLISLSGLPFTPSAAGWPGIIARPLSGVDFIFWLSHVLLLVGYLRHSFTPGDSLASMERWVQALYPFGFVMLIATHWLVALFNLRGAFMLGTAWVGMLSTIVALAAWLLTTWMRAKTPATETAGWFGIIGERAGAPLTAFFRLDWIYEAMGLLYRAVRRVVAAITLILEGDGGVLWVLVLLALLVSLIQSGGQP